MPSPHKNSQPTITHEQLEKIVAEIVMAELKLLARKYKSRENSPIQNPFSSVFSRPRRHTATGQKETREFSKARTYCEKQKINQILSNIKKNMNTKNNDKSIGKIKEEKLSGKNSSNSKSSKKKKPSQKQKYSNFL